MSILSPDKPRASDWRRPPEGEHGQILIEGVSWSRYVALTDALMDNPSIRATYDRGSLELVSTSNLHEWIKKRLGRFLEIIAEELEVSIQPGGNTSFRNEELERGFDPDECYWIASEATMRVPVASWDPALHPPPDLIIEIEVTRTALDRMAVFAAYRVPEVWRFDGESLRVHRLTRSGDYEEVTRSPTFAAIPLEEIARFMQPDASVDYLTAMKQFRDWVRTTRSG